MAFIGRVADHSINSTGEDNNETKTKKKYTYTYKYIYICINIYINWEKIMYSLYEGYQRDRIVDEE